MIRFAQVAILSSALLVAKGFVIPTPFRRSSTSSSMLKMSADLSDVQVMVNGMPGPMATAAAEACLRKGLKLAPVAMTGPAIEPCTITVKDAVSGVSADVKLVPADQKDEMNAAVDGLVSAAGEHNLLAIDFTHPSAVNGNAIYYAEKNIPFVMGTTGGDREQLMKDMEDAKHFSVIAPNMAKQIVALQAGLEDLAAALGAELDSAGRQREQRVVAAATNVRAGVEVRAALTNEDLAGVDDLAAETLHAQSLGVGVTTVTGRASALFVCHCCAFLGLT